MAKHFILFIISVICLTVSYGQKMNDYYVCIPVDSTRDCRLKFLNDTTVELSTIRRHMSGGLTIVLNCKITDTTIDILPELSKKDTLDLLSFGLNYFIKPAVHLTKIHGGFIDYSKSLIYVRQKDFDDNPDIIYMIDGKKFIQDIGKTDGYGIIKKKPKKNKALQRSLKGLDKDNCTIEIVKGLNAYKRFGIKSVYGVVVITSKQ